MSLMSKSKKAHKMIKNQRGFTLIEIIAVLIVLAILAAVAVPKYMDIVDEAKNSSAQAAVAEAFARLNNLAARFMINNGDIPAASTIKTTFEADATFANAGDYTIALGTADDTAGTIPVTTTGDAGTTVDGGLATGTWRIGPGGGSGGGGFGPPPPPP